MEYALRITAPRDPPRDLRSACPRAWRDLLPDGPAVALYFGSEFCEDLLPGADGATTYCAIARCRGLEPTLLTPLVTNAGLERVDRLLASLRSNGEQPAVVFNDWGVLGLLRERHPSLPRRAGRLMNRSLRDPRAYREMPNGGATHDASRYQRVHRHLERAGVCAVESDADLDGGYLGDGLDKEGRGLQRALHLPFTFAASGRNCPLKALLHPAGEAFAKVLADKCPAPCRTGAVPTPREDSTLAHWRAGNTLFYELPQAAAREWLAHTDRIVLHEEAAP